VAIALAALPANAQMIVAWDVARQLGTQSWHLSLVRMDGKVTMGLVDPLTLLDAQACQAASARTPGDIYDPAQTWCATFACPPPGAYELFLQVGDGEPSNVVVFGVGDGCTQVPYTEAMHRGQRTPSLPERGQRPETETTDPHASAEALEAQLRALQTNYETTQAQIVATYDQQRPTWATYQDAEEALNAAYRQALSAWEALNAEWLALQRAAAQARSVTK
jgi:hypothetical protein